jgi:hypothetical protein
MSLRQLQTAFLHLQFSFLHKSSHFFTKVLISSKKFSFLPKSSHFFPKVLISCNADRISSPQFSFLHKSSHFFQKVLISSQKFSFPEMQMSLRHSRGSFLKKESHFLERGHHFFTPAARYLLRTIPRRDIAVVSGLDRLPRFSRGPPCD